jgi:hypothetical protein
MRVTCLESRPQACTCNIARFRIESAIPEWGRADTDCPDPWIRGGKGQAVLGLGYIISLDRKIIGWSWMGYESPLSFITVFVCAGYLLGQEIMTNLTIMIGGGKNGK